MFQGAADELDDDAERGEHLWTADNGDRCNAKYENGNSTLTIVSGNGQRDFFLLKCRPPLGV